MMRFLDAQMLTARYFFNTASIINGILVCVHACIHVCVAMMVCIIAELVYAHTQQLCILILFYYYNRVW